MKRPDVVIRDASLDDLPHILRLVRGLANYERKLDEFTASESDLHEMLFGPIMRAQALLAETPGSSPIGIALFYYTISTFSASRGIFLEDLYVEPASRGIGIGSALLRRLAARAIADNCKVIEWRVLNWNQAAIDFYQRLGAAQMRDWHVRQLRGAALAALAKGVDNG